MHVNCPHCHNGIEVVDEASLTDIDCPSCGNHFSILGEDPNATLEEGCAHRTLGRFELINEVGVGASGSVWRGKDPELDRTVAVKIPRKGQLNKEESEQFFREARAAAQLKHPHIVPVHEIGKDRDTIYIVSDFVQGISLADRLTSGPMSMRESAKLCINVARALHHAHEKGVIHRDLKPGNIMLDDLGEPHVMDFGLAKRDAGEITMTVDGQILGTPAYMSPEQASGSAHDADGRSDVYSVGVILFQLITGELPFRGNMQMLIHQAINDEAPSALKLNSNIDRDLATITTKCMEKEPVKRYATANQLADDLQRYLDGEPIRARPIGGLERGWRWCKRKPALSGALALSTLLLTTLAIGGPIGAVRQAALKQRADDATEEALNEKDRANDEAAKARVAEADAKQSAKRSSDVLRIVTDSFKSANPEDGAKAQMTAKEVLFHANHLMGESELDELGKAKLLSALTASFIGLGEFDLAISSANDELRINEATLGPSHDDTLRSMNDLAKSFVKTGQFQNALELSQRTFDLTNKKLGPNHVETLRSMAILSASFSCTGRTGEALELAETVLSARSENLGPTHLDTVKSMANLALIYKNKKRLKEALQLEKKALVLYAEKFGSDHPDTLKAMNNLASTFLLTGQRVEALNLYEDALKRRMAKLGPAHPHTFRSMANLGITYLMFDRIEDGLAQLETALIEMTKKFAADHPEVKIVRKNLAAGYRKSKRPYPMAEFDAKRLSIAVMNFGLNHPDTLELMSNLAIRFENSGRFEAAHELEKIRTAIVEIESNLKGKEYSKKSDDGEKKD